MTEINVGDARVVFGDCRDVLKTLPDNSVDSIVTDPPYELGFMGKKWDSTGIAYDVTVWEECLRVLKPGGHILSFGGSRTWHRMAVAIEDAGFELRDSIAWMYGSGFPKSLDVGKAIQKASGVKHVDAIENVGGGFYGENSGWNPTPRQLIMPELEGKAKEWKGWGTALKPAFEPIFVGRKPFAKGATVAQNVLEWGVGGLNIDASRVGSRENEPQKRPASASGVGNGGVAYGTRDGVVTAYTEGRWPANVILDEFSAEILDEQSGVSTSKRQTLTSTPGEIYGNGAGMPAHTGVYGHNDSGGASRFFYCAKASKRDRHEGLEDLAKKENAGSYQFREDGSLDGKPTQPRQNFHPTVKPTELMRYLIKLVTPAGGLVLDPFTGSGSTGKAALLDGYKFVGAELTEEYLPIIEGRLKWAQDQNTGD